MQNEKYGEYTIRRLPKNSLVPDGQMWKIKGYAFPGIPMKFPVRKCAVNFACQEYQNLDVSPVYVFMYANENGAKALFFSGIHKKVHHIQLQLKCVELLELW